MPLESDDFLADENVDRRIPKRMRKSYDKRRGPVAARSSSHHVKPGSGLHRRHRRHYGL